jgi:hypothetical protein
VMRPSVSWASSDSAEEIRDLQGRKHRAAGRQALSTHHTANNNGSGSRDKELNSHLGQEAVSHRVRTANKVRWGGEKWT